MKYLKKFQNHNGYESFAESEEFLKPNVSLCKTEWECHYTSVPYAERYLTFKILSGGTINWKASTTGVTRTISYSKDRGKTWTDITSSTAGTSFNVSAGDVIMFKGNNNTYATSTIAHNSFNGSTAYFDIEGNMMSLISGDSFSAATALTSSYTFCDLFRNTKVVNARHLILPSTTLTDNCYLSMFQDCTSLKTAPELPATTLAKYCYQGMFVTCTSLTTAPALPATTLVEGCYGSMFSNCRSLATAPALPATTLANWCYESMFQSCTSLTTAPELPATTLAERCYVSMFFGCTSLTTAPELPATTLAGSCYGLMFHGCTSLTTAPELPATTLVENCYESMFDDCTSLTTVPELPATTLAQGCYDDMFNGCRSLTTAPELPATTLAGSCYSSMFYGCTSLAIAPELPATTLANYCYYEMFSGCTSLTTAPRSIGDRSTTVPASACSYMFSNCTSLATAPELPATTLTDNCYEAMFNDCTSLTTAPSVLPATSLADCCYYQMFSGCTNLVSGPSSIGDSSTTMATNACTSMFAECSGLTTAPELPSTTLAASCYAFMFDRCASLTTAPELPATTLADGCYSHMFAGCSNLATAPELPATMLASRCYQYMFAQCTTLNSVTCLATGVMLDTDTEEWLYGVAQTGTFRKYTTTSFSIGDSGIPTGWTVDNIEPDYEKEYLTLEILTGGSIVWNSSSSYTTTISYSIDDLPWQTVTSLRGGRTIVTLSPGHTIKFKGVNSSYGMTNPNTYCTFSGSTASFNVRGNIMSMIYGDDFTGTTLTSNLAFPSLFRTTKVVSARNLVLPSSAVPGDSYRLMFSNCTGLTEAPSVLPGTQLGITCYQGMFSGCTSLTLAPNSIGSSSTYMAASACTNMFYRCTSLTTAPELPVRTLASYCYAGMFTGCAKLNSITCLATNISASNCLASWVNSVAPTGTFVKAASMSWPRGTSGIPSKWTVVEADS